MIGAWRSLVAHLAGGQGVAGSNPVAPTISNIFEYLPLYSFFLYSKLFDTDNCTQNYVPSRYLQLKKHSSQFKR